MTNSDNTTTWGGGGVDAPVVAATYGRFVAERTLGAGGMGVVIAAFDPQLDRRVALKLLRPRAFHGDTGEVARARLLREAQAMARLAHPNVVTVFEVGQAGDQLFIAMELVEGQTLKAWLRARSRPDGEVLDVFLAAGRGLEAAHGAGLVHRDFKPDNVLIGTDGRPRVLDFGLVATGVRLDSADDVGSMESGLTVEGAIMGTPAYMSPEQLAGDEVDARSDQFSFAVAFWEALAGERPFDARELGGLRAEIAAARVRPMPRARRVPAWLQSALMRALSADPAQRWLSMRALLDAIEAWRRRRRRLDRALIAALAVGAVSGGALWWSGQERCAAPDARIAEVWSSDVQARLRPGLARADPVHGEARLAVATRVLDHYLGEWRAMYTSACRATRIEGRQSDTLMDLRMRCLDARLTSVARTVAQFDLAADPRAVDRAMSAVANIGLLDGCADARALEGGAAQPESPTERVEAAAIAAQRGELEIEHRAGPTPGLLARARALGVRATALGHPATLAPVLELIARIEIADEFHRDALATLERLATVAAAAQRDDEVAFAWSSTARLKGWELAKPDEALALLPAARAAAVRAGSPLSVEVDRLIAESIAYASTGRIPDAASALLDAERRLRAAGAAEPGSTLAATLGQVVMLEAMNHVNTDGELALREAETALDIHRAAYGAEHGALSLVYLNIGALQRRLGRYEEAHAALTHAYALAEARIGESPLLIKVATQLGTVERELHHPERALPLLERAVALSKQLLRGDDVHTLWAILAVGANYEDLGRNDEARAAYEEVADVAARNGVRHPNIAIALFNAAELAARANRCEEAVGGYQRAVVMLEDVDGSDSVYLPYVLRGLGACLVTLGRAEEAEPVLERVLAWPQPGRAAPQLALAAYWMARLHISSGRDVRRNRARARAALEEVRASRELEPDRVEALERALGR